MRSYWLDLFTGTTWQEFMDAGRRVTGFRETRWKTVQQIKPRDYLLCYLTGLSRWIGVLEATSEPFKDSTRVWRDEDSPCRVNVKPIVTLTPETAVPIHELRDRLTMFRDLKNPVAWTGYFRGSPAKLRESDGKAVVDALVEAEKNPVHHPVDPAKLARRPRALKAAKIGSVTVPGAEEQLPVPDTGGAIKETTAHGEVQWLLLKLGNDMGLDVWVAKNDRGREVAGNRFSDLRNLRAALPLQFDEATNRTVELIDVLWLKGNAIVAAFEVESTTSIYSGLLRMADLIAMQPNLNIPLYLVAPADRRERVIAEVNRPTFSRLTPPMAEMCRFISFSVLRDHLKQAAPYVRHMKPDFIEELSESCEIEEA